MKVVDEDRYEIADVVILIGCWIGALGRRDSGNNE